MTEMIWSGGKGILRICLPEGAMPEAGDPVKGRFYLEFRKT
jgi:hypothetical protein